MGLRLNHAVLAKVESTYGTDASPAGTDAILCSEPTTRPLVVDLQDRALQQGSMGNTQKVVGRRLSEISMAVELAGSGAAGTAPKLSRLLQACGFSETVVADTSVTMNLTDTPPGLTLDYFADEILHKATGCRGSFQLEAAAGEIPRITFSYTGLYVAPTEPSLPTLSFTEQAAPVAFGADNTQTVSVDGYAACISSFSLDLGAVTPFTQRAGCSRQVRYTDRKPSGTIKIENPSLADKNYWATVADQSLVSLSFTHGTTAGNIVQVNLLRCNFDSPTYEEEEGIDILSIPFMPNPANGTADEIQFVFT